MDEFARFILAFFGVVLLVFYLGCCTPLYGARTAFQYEIRPLVTWGYWSTGYPYSAKWYWHRTNYAIR